MAAPKKKPVRQIRHNTLLPPVAQAANIALLIIGASGKSNWAAVVADPDSHAHVRVTEAQQQLLDDHSGILPIVSKQPAQSVYACPVCGRFAFIGKGAPPAKCNLTLGCSGRTARASTISPRLPKSVVAIEPPRTSEL